MNNKKFHIIIIVLLAVIAVLLALLLFLPRARENGAQAASRLRDPNAALGQIEGKTKQEIQEELNRVVQEGMFNISINPTPVFENGSAEGNLRIENVPGNTYLMSVEISLDDTGEVIYTSGLIEPNYHIQTAALDVPLSAGTYAATATFSACDPDSETVVGQAAAKITITVQN